MQLLNEYEISYVNHLLGTERVVLRGDRERGDSPNLKILWNNKLDLILKIDSGIKLENMISDPYKGAKERLDIHFDLQNLGMILFDLKEYINKNQLKNNPYNSRLYDPTGKEHKEGLSLGDVKFITDLPVKGIVCYSDLNKIATFSKLYIDSENYPKKQRYHLGAQTIISEESSKQNLVEFTIDSKHVYRFAKSIELAMILLSSYKK